MAVSNNVGRLYRRKAANGGTCPYGRSTPRARPAGGRGLGLRRPTNGRGLGRRSR